jgi:hypothetical protein
MARFHRPEKVVEARAVGRSFRAVIVRFRAVTAARGGARRPYRGGWTAYEPSAVDGDWYVCGQFFWRRGR